MTDVYQFEDYVESARRRKTAADVMQGFDTNPDDAARALDLSQATGDSAGVIAQDVPSYEDQLKRVTSSRIVTSSDTLRQFVEQNRMAASVAQDDWDNLSEYDKALKNIGHQGPVKEGEVFKRAAKAWKEAYDEGRGFELTELLEEQFRQSMVGPASMGATLGYGTMAALNRGFRALGAIPHAAYAGWLQAALESGADPYEAKRQARAAGEFAEFWLMDIARQSGHLGVRFPRAELERTIQQTSEASRLGKTYIQADKDIPPGLHSAFDDVAKTVAKDDVKMIDEAAKAADATNLKERSPTLLQNLTRIVTGDRYAEVDADAIAGLYAGKKPMPDDQILGWISDLERQIQEANEYGGRIRVPLDQWVVNTTPEVRQALKNDVAIRSGANTVNDWSRIPDAADPPYKERWNEDSDSTRLWEAVEAERKSLNIQPKLAVFDQPQKLQLMRGKPVPFPELAGEHSFMIQDEIGRHVADLEIDTRNGGKDLYVKWLGGRYIPHQVHQPVSNIFGPGLMRDLFRQIRDEFPNAETISGHRISGAREGTVKEGGEVKINIDALRAELEDPAIYGKNAADFMDVAESGEWANLTDRVSYWHDMREEWKPHELEIERQIDTIMERLAPKGLQVTYGTKRILFDGLPQRGMYQGFPDQMPVVLWSLDSKAPLATARHEALHHLKTYGFITHPEWEALKNAAAEGNWIDKHKIRENYPGLRLIDQVEEAVAHEFESWSKDKPVTRYSKTFERMYRLFQEIKDIFRRIAGRDVTAEEVFRNIESGRVGRRPMGEVEIPYYDPRAAYQVAGPFVPKAARLPPKEPMLPGIIPHSEREPFEPGAIMPTGRQRKYERLIEQQRNDDQRLMEKAAEKEVKDQASKEWLDNAAARLPQVQKDIHESIPFAVERFFRQGEIQGQKLDKRPKINPEFVSKDYLREIPEEFLSKKGENPDTLAGLFGLANGEELLDTIAQFRLARGELGPKAYEEKIVGMTLQRQMEKEFGAKGDAILKQAQDHVWSNRQLDLLHEDVVAQAAALGQEITFTAKDIQRQFERRLDKMVMKDAEHEGAARALYRAGGKLEDSLLKGDAIGAFREAQRKENAFALGQGIRKLDRERSKHDTLVKRYRKREIEGADPGVTNFIHDALARIGESSRPPTDIAREMAASQWKNWEELDNFLKANEQISVIPDFLKDPTWKAPIDNAGQYRADWLTVEMWRAVNDAITMLDKYSRDTKAYTIAGEKFDLRKVIDEDMIPAIEKGYPKLRGTGAEALAAPEPGIANKLARSYFAQSLHLETVFNWFDRNHPKGVFNQGIVRKYTDAANYADKLDKDFGDRLAKLPKIENPNKLIKQNVFKNPDTGEPLTMTRMNILGILQNMGNPSNFYKMLDGFGIERSRAGEVAQLVWNNTTKKDLYRAVGLGRIFSEAKDLSDKMYRNLSGVAPTRVDVWTVHTPWGDVEGWYHPLIYDKKFKQTSAKLSAPNPVEFPAWTKSTLTAAGYTKQRTNYTGPLLLDMNGFQNKLAQITRDTAWRPTLIDLNKIFKDQNFRQAIREHWGPHYEALLDPFLKDMAGHRDVMDANSAVWQQSIQFVRQNIISHMVGVNPATIMKHSVTAAVQSITEVGYKDYSRAMFSLLMRNPETGESNWRFAMNKGLELQRRHRNAYEGITSNFDRVYGDLKTAGLMRSWLDNFDGRPLGEAARLSIADFKGKYMEWRDFLHYWEAWPMAMSDLLSAVPTWLARYRQAKMAGENEGNAIFMADRAVRRAHGSSAITSRAAIIRNNPIGTIFGNFYTFFSHILQRQVEMAWETRAALRKEGFYMRQPEINRQTGELRPPELAEAKKGRYLEGETEGEYKLTDDYKYGMALMGPMVGMFVAYYLFPAFWDEFVAPKHAEKGIGPDKKENTLTYLALVELHGLAGSWIGARDIMQAIHQGGDVSNGILGEFSKSLIYPWRDVAKGVPPSTKKKEKLIKDVNSLMNMMTGGAMPNSVPRMGIFGANWYMRMEHPHNFREFWTGITRGTVHPKH